MRELQFTKHMDECEVSSGFWVVLGTLKYFSTAYSPHELPFNLIDRI